MTCTSPEGKPYKERPAPRHTPCDCRQRRSCHSNPGRTCTSAWWHCIQTFRGRSGGSRNRSEAQSSAAVATRMLACSTSPRTHLRTLVRSGKILYTGPCLQNRRLLTRRTSSCTQNAPLLYTSTLYFFHIKVRNLTSEYETSTYTHILPCMQRCQVASLPWGGEYTRETRYVQFIDYGYRARGCRHFAQGVVFVQATTHAHVRETLSTSSACMDCYRDLAQALGTLASGRLTSESMAHGRRTDRPAHTSTISPLLHPGPSLQTASPAAVHPPCTFRGGPRSQQWTRRQRTNQLI